MVEHTRRGCWIPRRRRTKGGYAKIGGRYGHVVAYELWKGPIPPGAKVHHKCGEEACWNPMHTRAVSHSANVLDGFARKHGQMSRGQLRLARWMHREFVR